ncbi:MAG: spermidine/putrescine ABC transporter substrate-binding protein [Lachnospiraceae bacterium]|nr:spermidine/putrescine ABC transporter substrate-binding protein [Lachnospiraceae bacterium]
MKKWLAFLFAAVCLFTFFGCAKEEEEVLTGDELVVFNYGDYIDRDLLRQFEAETGIKVKYEEYVTPEDMYTKYQSGSIKYDLIITSEYMVEKMIEAGEVLEIDMSQMENIGNIDQTYWDFCQAFDKENKYAVPYFWGTVGILYNTTMVDEEIDSWSILWDETYKNNLVMSNSVRDSFVVPLKLMGKSLNTTDHTILEEAKQMLIEQKPLVQAYYVDQSRDALISGDAAMAVIYSGDAIMAMDYNEDLDYVVPKEGSNVWLDCLMIPKTCQHKEAAEMFIDFLCDAEVGLTNYEYVYYPTPNAAVYEMVDEEDRNNPAIFPPDEVMEKCEVFQYLGPEMESYYAYMWKELKSE